MRNLFLLLVLANLGFAAWHSWFAAAPAGSTHVVTSSEAVPSLMLVGEADRAAGGDSSDTAGAAPGGAAGSSGAASTSAAARTSGAASTAGDEGTSGGDDASAAGRAGGARAAGGEQLAAADVTASKATAAARCISVGPFRELAQAAAAAASLRQAGYEPTQRVAEGDIWVGYWVYIAGIPTREKANEELELLQSNNVSDSYVTPGDDGYLISLGVFSEIARAGRRREAARALGLEPTVVDRTRRGTVYWVDLSLAEGKSLDLETLQTPGRITRLEQRGCDTSEP